MQTSPFDKCIPYYDHHFEMPVVAHHKHTSQQHIIEETNRNIGMHVCLMFR